MTPVTGSGGARGGGRGGGGARGGGGGRGGGGEGGGGYSGTIWIPTAKWLLRGKVVNTKMYDRSAPFRLNKKGVGGQLCIKNIIRAVSYKLCLLYLYFRKFIIYIVRGKF